MTGFYDKYKVKTYPARIGWWADVVNIDEVGLDVQTAKFWRPTKGWVNRRAERHIFPRLARAQREAQAEVKVYG